MTDVLRPRHPVTNPISDSDSLSDSELIALVRAGDAAAYEELFLRHREVAIRYARRLSDSERAEDLCAEAFTKILDLLQRGKGPDVAFRAYLLTTVRTSHLNTLRSSGREDLVPDHEPISRMMPVIEDPDARFDRAAIYRAFSQLPERWQRTLWLTAVEGLTHEEVSEHLGIKANAVASLAFRARAGLRQAYLSEHLIDTRDPQCRTVVEQLPHYVRDRLSSRRRRVVQEHLDGCADCTKAALELSEVDSRLGGLLAPFALVGIAAGSTTLAAPATGLVALVKGAAGTMIGNVKALGTTLPAVVGTKAAAVATVTALGVAVGAEVVHQSDDSPAQVPPTSEVSRSKVVPLRLPPPSSTGPAVSTPAAALVVPFVDPTSVAVLPPALGPAPTRSPSSGPSASPTPSASPSASPTSAPPPTTSAPRMMAIGPATSEHYQRNGARWERITIPVADPPKGATLVVTTNRTYQTVRATTTGTGWVCGVPTTNWVDGAAYASTKTVCSYSTDGDGTAPRFDYNVAPNARLTAAVSGPAGYLDTSLLDNLIQLVLRA